MWSLLQKFAPVLLLTLPLSSCTTLRVMFGGEVKSPLIQIVGIKITEWSLDHIDCRVDIQVTNQEDFRVEFANIQYSAMLPGGSEVAKGQNAHSIILPPLGHTVVGFPLSLKVKNLMQYLQDTKLRRESAMIVFHLDGEIVSSLGNIRIAKVIQKSLDGLVVPPGH